MIPLKCRYCVNWSEVEILDHLPKHDSLRDGYLLQFLSVKEKVRAIVWNGIEMLQVPISCIVLEDGFQNPQNPQVSCEVRQSAKAETLDEFVDRINQRINQIMVRTGAPR